MDDQIVKKEDIEKLLDEEKAARERLQKALHQTLLPQPVSKEQPIPISNIEEVATTKKIDDSSLKPENIPMIKEKLKEYSASHKGIPGVEVSKTSDPNTLVNVHVNNPMKRVIELLEDIKKQKAFSFTLRGSLGIMGVILTLSVFGVFGGGQILCDKGLQTRSGTLRVLQVTEEHTDPTIPWTKAMLQKMFGVSTPITRQRVVLLPENAPPIHLFMTLKHKPDNLNGQQVIATGTLNSCSSTLSIPNEQSLESYSVVTSM